ncbi:hypothetical protein D9M68_550800 [compost metagenome]
MIAPHPSFIFFGLHIINRRLYGVFKTFYLNIFNYTYYINAYTIIRYNGLADHIFVK